MRSRACSTTTLVRGLAILTGPIGYRGQRLAARSHPGERRRPPILVPRYLAFVFCGFAVAGRRHLSASISQRAVRSTSRRVSQPAPAQKRVSSARAFWLRGDAAPSRERRRISSISWSRCHRSVVTWHQYSTRVRRARRLASVAGRPFATLQLFCTRPSRAGHRKKPRALQANLSSNLSGYSHKFRVNRNRTTLIIRSRPKGDSRRPVRW